MKRVLVYIFLIQVVLISDLQGTQRNVVAELFTNWGCPSCPVANHVLDTLSEEFPDLLVIRYHTYWPDGGDPYYNANTQENNDRINYYNVDYVPHLFYDGTLDGQYFTNIWRNYLLTEMNSPSPLEINLNIEYDENSREGTVIATVTATDSITEGNLFLRYVITESNIYNPSPNGETHHNQIMRDMFPSSHGVPISIQYGETIVDTENFSVDSTWNDINLQLIVFVQSDQTRHILQAAGTPVSIRPLLSPDHYRLEEESGNGNGVADPGDQINLYLTIKNEGTGSTNQLTATLTPLDQGYTVNNGTISLEDILPDSTIEYSNAFSIDISPSVSTPDSAHFLLHFEDSTGTLWEDTLLLLVGFPVGFEDDVEQGERHWTHYGAYEQWHITEHRSNSPTHSWYCGLENYWRYVNNCDGYLESSYFVVPPNGTFSFSHWYYMEQDYDFGILEMDFGFGFKEIASYTGVSGTWKDESFDLSDYAGSPFRVRFHFKSDASIMREGWYIDDINLTPVSVRERTSPQEDMEKVQLTTNISRGPIEIQLVLERKQHVSIKVYDATGRLERVIKEGILPKGINTIKVNKRFKPGVHFIRVKTQNWTRTERFICVN